jgi:hypothetical protein
MRRSSEERKQAFLRGDRPRRSSEEQALEEQA